jgi:hypothetical protein
MNNPNLMIDALQATVLSNGLSKLTLARPFLMRNGHGVTPHCVSAQGR